MAAHTPGPWINGDGDRESILSPASSYYCVAQANKALEEWPSNARLIAAAPELLDALRQMVTWYARRESASTHGLAADSDALLPYEGQEPEVRTAMDAIAKATQP